MSKRPALYQQFDPARALEADEEGLYVDWQKKLGLDDVKIRLSQSIALSGSLPVCRLFTGHRGVGKTTELKRVKRILERGQDGSKLFVCLLEAEQWMHLEDVTATDIVFHMVRQIVDDLKQAGFDFGMTKLTEFFAELGELLKADVDLKGIKVAGVAEFSVALKDNPAIRGTLRKLLEGHLPTIFDLINKVILKEAREWLAKPDRGGYTGILVVVDQLDRIPRKVINDQGLTNHENLFLDNAGQLKFLGCDTLYTVPIELAYSRCRDRLKSAYAAEILTLPLIPVSQRDDAVFEPGLEALCEIVERRTRRAGATPDELLASPELKRLCRLSGGHVRNLFILIRSAIERCPTLPVTTEAVQRTVRKQADDINIAVRSEERKALQAVHESKRPYEADADLWYELLLHQMAFTYADDRGLWYDWNPLFAEVVNGGAA